MQINVSKQCYFFTDLLINKVVKAAKIVSANKVVSLIHPRTGRGLITTASSGFGFGRTGTRIVVLMILV